MLKRHSFILTCDTTYLTYKSSQWIMLIHNHVTSSYFLWNEVCFLCSRHSRMSIWQQQHANTVHDQLFLSRYWCITVVVVQNGGIFLLVSHQYHSNNHISFEVITVFTSSLPPASTLEDLYQLSTNNFHNTSTNCSKRLIYYVITN